METTYPENYTKQLQRLLNVVNKSKKKYLEASNDIDSPELKNLFNQFISERQTVYSELKTEINKRGGDIEEIENDSALKPHHFNSLKSGAATHNDQSVLEKIRNTEQEALDAYDDVLQGSILEEFDLKTLIGGQRLIINEAFTELDRRYFSMFQNKQAF